MDPERSPILQYFAYGHLNEKLRPISKDFSSFAEHLELILPKGPEKTVALRKLLEAKDAAIRAALDNE